MREKRTLTSLTVWQGLLAAVLVIGIAAPVLARRDCRPNSRDRDHDGITDCVEKRITRTDRRDADTDHDGISDSKELERGTDPLLPDSDGDGITDGEEVLADTDPLNPDSDGDGIPDLSDTDPTASLATRIAGSLDAVDPQAGTLTLLGKVIDANTARFEGVAALAELAPGMHVEVKLDPAAAANSQFVAVEVDANDLDSDGSPNYRDNDDDNDGIPDALDPDDNNNGINDDLEDHGPHHDGSVPGDQSASNNSGDNSGTPGSTDNSPGDSGSTSPGDDSNVSSQCQQGKSEIHLANVGPSPFASGQAKYEAEKSCSNPEFGVEVKNLMAGSYNLIVGGTVRGTITVWANSHNGESEIKFKGVPEKSSDLQLTFDPRGSLIEIEKGGTVYLSGLLP